MGTEMKTQLLASVQQKRIVRGLKRRFSLFDQRLAESSHQSVQEEQRLRDEFERSSNELEHQLRSERAHAYTSNDDELDAAWGEMESTTFHSTHLQKNSIRKWEEEYKGQVDHLHKAHAKARAELQKEYDAVKLHPGKRFEHKKAELEGILRSNEAEYDRCLQLIAARSLSASFEEPQADATDPDTLPHAYEALQDYKRSIQASYQALKRHPAARLVESYGLWLVTLALGGLGATIGWLTKLDPLWIVGIGIGSAVVGLIGLIIILRPAMSRFVRSEMPKARLAMMQSERAAAAARRMLEHECQQEQHRLRAEFKHKLEKLDGDHETQVRTLKEAMENRIRNLIHTEQIRRDFAARNHLEVQKRLTQEFKPRLEGLIESQNEKRITVRRQLEERLHASKRGYREGLAFIRTRVHQAMAFSEQARTEATTAQSAIFPSWDDRKYWEAKWDRRNDDAILPLGKLLLRIGSQAESKEKEQMQFYGEFPLAFRMIEDGCLVVEASHPNARVAAQSIAKNLILRAFTSLPAGQLQTTIIDPDGLGKDYSWLMHLADADPRLVNYRVWTQTNHIAEQVARLSHHTEDVIQQLLRDRYADLRKYNRDAGTMAESYRLLVWSRFPIGLDETSWKSLCSLLSSGGRCGVGVILLYDPTVSWPFMADDKRLGEAGLKLRIHAESGSEPVATVVDPDLDAFQLQLELPPDDEMQHQILERCAEDALQGNRVEVPFDTILPPEEARGIGSSAEGLAIPIGQSGIGRAQSLRLGAGTAQHVLIAGKTGSGKSSLLHTMISSAALKYGPDQLRLVLLDFKKGVEFQVYSESKIPHADIIGIESQREFGLSALEHLDRVMQTRGELFRAAGVQDVASWVRKNPTRPMPRILVVVDEFQELFVEDDKLAQQASMLLDRIVRQGRSFGMHVVLASQTLGGAYSLPRTTLAQMAVRIALQCEGSDAMLILSEDNLAAERLRHAGQAIYNDASGRIEGNQPFQVAYLSKETQLKRLSAIPVPAPFVDESNRGLGKCIIFEGHKAATWHEQEIESALKTMAYRETTAVGGVLGDSVSIEPAVGVQWTRQAGRNLLLVGTEDRNAASCLGAVLATSLWSSRHRLNQSARVYVLDGTRPDDTHTSFLPAWIRSLEGDHVVADVRGCETMMQQLHDEWNRRMESAEEMHPPLYLVFLQLGRFRELRKSEEFSFGEDSGTTKADQVLQNILRDGPSVGMHSLIWVDNWNTLSRWIPRQSMHDLEMRVLMQMSANDSNHLIDSAAANRLDQNVLLMHDEATGQSRKFRPYRLADPVHLSKWVQGSKEA